MAHELDFSRKTARANMFSVKTIPWHADQTNPHILEKAPTFEEALAIAEIDYEVKTFPIRVAFPNGMSIDSPTGQAIVRMDRLPNQQAILGIVGDGYTPLQNREAFEILEPLIDKGLLELHTGGVLREGADAWLLGKLINPKIEDALQGRTVPFTLFTNNHNGKGKVTGTNTPVEVVCANTLAVALHGVNKTNSIVLKKHTRNVRLNFLEAAMVFFERTLESYELIAEDFQNMRSRILTVEEFTKHVLDEVAPIPKIEKEDKTSHSDAVIERAEQKRNRLTFMWENATGNTGNHSAYEAYMGVTELLDYSDDLIKIRKNSSRLQSIIGGPIQDIKQRVVNSLVAISSKN